MFILSTGRFLHALGNVYTAQGDVRQGFDYHRKALKQYKSTIGNNHHRTGDANISVADHLLRLNKPKEAL